jgi:DNA recombination protein RmuC
MGDIERLHDRVLNLQKHFGQANEDLKQILISAEKVEKRAARIQDVEFEGEQPAPMAAVIPAPLPRLAAGE